MRPEELKEIEGRLTKATPGPWTTKKPGIDSDGWSKGVIIACVGRGQCVYGTPPGGSFPASDQDFIAHARTDIQLLLLYILKLEGEKEALAQEVHKCGTFSERRGLS
ncbi:MAG: hypothetical protein ACYDBI_05955 [Thermoplasmataceae archaeon]